MTTLTELDSEERKRRLRASSCAREFKDALVKNEKDKETFIKEILSTATFNETEKNILTEHLIGLLKQDFKNNLIKLHKDGSSSSKMAKYLNDIINNEYITDLAKLDIINSTLLVIGMKDQKQLSIPFPFNALGNRCESTLKEPEAFYSIMSSILISEESKTNVIFSMNNFGKYGYLFSKFENIEQIKKIIKDNLG